MKNSWGRRLQ